MNLPEETIHRSNIEHPRLYLSSHRPGRKPLRQTPNVDLAQSYGDAVSTRNPEHIRILFQNVKGLTHSSTGEDYDYYLSCVSDLDADIVGMAETNTAWDHPYLRQAISSRLKRHYQMSRVSFSSPSHTVDPMPDTESYQAGGTATFTNRKMVPFSYGAVFQDPTGLGRWNGLHFRGRNNTQFTVLTGYRVCSGSINTASIGSAAAGREHEYLRIINGKTPSPRKAFLQDLSNTIKGFQEDGNLILDMLDSNGRLEDDAELQQFLVENDLRDLHPAHPSPSTYIGSDTRRIDHMLGCPKVYSALAASGSLSYLEGPQSDHRGLFVDLDPLQILQTTTSQTISTPNARLLKSGNPEHVEAYQTAMNDYYTEHSMMEGLTKSMKSRLSCPSPVSGDSLNNGMQTKVEP